jgi:hypothetical protein
MITNPRTYEHTNTRFPTKMPKRFALHLVYKSNPHAPDKPTVMLQMKTGDDSKGVAGLERASKSALHRVCQVLYEYRNVVKYKINSCQEIYFLR